MLFSKESLAEFDGRSDRMYLSILGEVFDVTKGTKFYGVSALHDRFSET
jgi:predicted heme/steroid binding protein